MRVFQRFATVDALSSGRAEVILGRGSFTESFPLFGYDLTDYEVLFEEKIDLFHGCWTRSRSPGRAPPGPPFMMRTYIRRPIRGDLARRASAGHRSPCSAPPLRVRAHAAIIGGAPARFAPLPGSLPAGEQELGTTAQPVGMHSPGFVAATDAEAKELFYPGFKEIATGSGHCADGSRSAGKSSTPRWNTDRCRRFGRDGRDQDRQRDPGAGWGPVRHDLLRRGHRFRRRPAALGRALRHPGHPLGPRASGRTARCHVGVSR